MKSLMNQVIQNKQYKIYIMNPNMIPNNFFNITYRVKKVIPQVERTIQYQAKIIMNKDASKTIFLFIQKLQIFFFFFFNLHGIILPRN